MLTSLCFRTDPEYAQLLQGFSASLGGTSSLPFAASGLCDGAADALLLALAEDIAASKQGPLLAVCADERECRRRTEMLCAAGLRAVFFTARDLNFYNIAASHEYEQARVAALFALAVGDIDAVLTVPDAMLGFTVPRARLLDATLRLDFDTRTEVDALAEQLTLAGYVRVDMVEAAGQFAVRGGIVDIFAPYMRCLSRENEVRAQSAPLRIELFGDEIDRMGCFDPETQRITLEVTGCEIPPARELLMNEESRATLIAAVERRLKKCTDEAVADLLRGELAELCKGGVPGFADKYLSLIAPEKECLLSYFTKKTPVLVMGTNAVQNRIKGAEQQLHLQIKDLLEGGTVSGRYAEYARDGAYFEAFLSRNVALFIDSMAEGLGGRKMAGLFSFRTRHTVAYGENFDLLSEDMSGFVKTGTRVVLMTDGEMSAKNLQGVLQGQGYRVSLHDPQRAALPAAGEVLVAWQECAAGFEMVTSHVALLSMGGDMRVARAADVARLRRSSGKKDAKRAILSYAELQIGDLVVHDAYGIGRYMGIKSRTFEGITSDFAEIQYAGTDKLFLPCNRLERLSKYIGAHADDGMVKLSRMGGGDWKSAKTRAKKAAKDIAKDLLRLYAERERKRGFAFPPDDDMQLDFEAAFHYEETEAQLHAAEEIKQDMMSVVPMDRLLCGDVGFGKTEVALRAAYKAILAGKQVAILVPTTILAMQHFATIRSRMRPFAVRADMLSRFRTTREITQVLHRLARGDIDIVVGTHRLVSKDVRFKDLGLLIVDEEQRFGVAQKEKLKQLAANVDVLTLTATPIPRTLNMAMSGIRDISVLDEAPEDRLPVQTYVLEHEPLLVEEAIRRELRRGGQVFYLHNDVASIYAEAARITHAFPEARVTVAHGQMDKDTLEEIWGDMLAGNIDVLVSTTIIETGIDVPNANTLIVDHAHRMGLSQLHQLRGRVGRSARRAYAYFTYPRGRALTDIQRKRLEAVREYAEFGAGFRIALRDMELRGAGNLLGAEQHGHLDAVGYELYIKLLNEAVLEEKGEVIAEKPECIISVSFDACLPESYVPSASQRVALYRRISLIAGEYDRADMTDELLDRYGELPRAAQNLLLIALCRALGEQCGIKQIRQDGNAMLLLPIEADTALWLALSEEFPTRLKMLLGDTVRVRYQIKEKNRALEELKELLLRAAYHLQNKR